MKLLNSLFQLNETLIRWQAKCHIEVKGLIGKCLSCFSFSTFLYFALKFMSIDYRHNRATERARKKERTFFFNFLFICFVAVHWVSFLLAVCLTNCNKKTINRIDKLKKRSFFTRSFLQFHIVCKKSVSFKTEVKSVDLVFNVEIFVFYQNILNASNMS